MNLVVVGTQGDCLFMLIAYPNSSPPKYSAERKDISNDAQVLHSWYPVYGRKYSEMRHIQAGNGSIIVLHPDVRVKQRQGLIAFQRLSPTRHFRLPSGNSQGHIVFIEVNGILDCGKLPICNLQ